MKLFALLILVAACGGEKKEAPAGPRKLSKMDVRVSVDGKGRIRPMFQLFDQKMKPIAVTGTYAVVVTRRDGTELCKLDGMFAPTDFTDTQVYRAAYRDASCPADPGADDLKVVVKVESPDKTIERTLELPARMIYENLKPPPAPAGSGSSAAGSGSATPADTAKPAGSAVPAEAPADTPTGPGKI